MPTYVCNYLIKLFSLLRTPAYLMVNLDASQQDFLINIDQKSMLKYILQND